MSQIFVLDSAQEAASACAQAIEAALARALETNSHATLAVSGGSTPKMMFRAMRAGALDYSRVHLYWVDERCVPPDHPDSNFGMANDALLDHIHFGRVHRMEGELAPEDAAARYTELLPSRFDVIHLGMGADAHTASLFPGLAEIEDREHRVGAVFVPKLAKHRLTLLPETLLSAAKIVVLSVGADKADALRHAFATDYRPLEFPIQLIHRNASDVDWFVDRAAKP